MKSTIVLKNMNSNLIEEAIIVFRDNVKLREKQLIKGEETDEKINETEKIIIDEAEHVILNYINEYEKKEKQKVEKTKLSILKGINIFLIISLVIAIIF